jgi:hypothetical protein|tara:strand:+ start:395 stop:643 length:249 start_codon:yes stop_codon:yes gene_type:complete
MSDEFDYKIITKEAKISILYQAMTELETEIFTTLLQQPIMEDPNYPEWEYNYKITLQELEKYRGIFEELGGNYDFNRVKKTQ